MTVVLDRIARALMLTDVERERLFRVSCKHWPVIAFICPPSQRASVCSVLLPESATGSNRPADSRS